MSKINFPLAIMSGAKDRLANPKDVQWTSKQLEHTTIFKHEYPIGHMSFAIAKDMSFFTSDLMAILNKHHDKPYTLTHNWKDYLSKKKQQVLLLLI